jgi:hypothetical protein
MGKELQLKGSMVFCALIFCQIAQGDLRTQTTQPSKHAVAPFALTIRAVEPTTKMGSPLLVEATTTNESRHEISVYRDNAPDQGGLVYKTIVSDENGIPATETKRGRRLQGHDTPEEQTNEPYVIVSGGGHGSLGPGKKIIDRVDLTKLYCFDHPVKYLIQFQVFDEETKGFVLSNSITVNLTP